MQSAILLQEGLGVVAVVRARFQGNGVTRIADEEGTSNRGQVHPEAKLITKIRPPTDSARG